MSGEGTVHFSVPAVPDGAGPVVEIRDHDLRLVKRAEPGQEVNLDAGVYLTSVVVPAGGSDQQAIEVKPGGNVKVELGPSETALRAEPAATRRAALAADLPQELVLKTSRTARAETSTDDWFARAMWAASGEPVVGEELLEPRSHAPDPRAPVTDLACRVPASPLDGLMCLQVAAPGQVPFNCMLPMLPGAGPGECRIRVVATAEAVRATALPAGGPLADSVAAYVITGHVRQAAHVVENARHLLYEKIADPVAAAVGGFALLRLRRLDDVEDWMHNLASWFPSLPDGAILAAEQAVRRGDDAATERWLREAVRRGTPMLSDGLSLLVTRLRPLGGKATADDAITRILDIATLVDFAQLVVAFPGADPRRPADSQQPAGSFTPNDGWQRFRRGEAVAT